MGQRRDSRDVAEAYRLLIADVYELAAVSRRTSEQIAEAEGQTVARWHVLSVLSDRPLTVSAAARRLGLARQSVHRVVNDLLADGLLAADPNPDHRSAPLISTTAAGDRVLHRLVQRGDDDRHERLSALGLSPEELQRARRTLRTLLDALSA
jgi:DNA-binding MarR family transcriptional regulator